MLGKEFFENKLNKYNSFKKKLDKKFNVISQVRLVIFIVGVLLSVLMFIKDNVLIGIGLLLLTLIVFVILIIIHQNIVDKIQRNNNYININKKYISRIDGNWDSFEENGEIYRDENHSYSNDLDIFGHGSLYQLINNTNTYLGKEYLKKLLRQPNMDIQDILKRQQAVKDLEQKIEFCQMLECEGMNITTSKENPDQLIEYVEDNSKLFKSQNFMNIFYLLPAVTILAFIFAFVFKKINVYMPYTLLFIQTIIFGLGFTKTYPILIKVKGIKKQIQSYQHMIKTIENEKFKDEYLNKMRNKLYNDKKSASHQIMELEKILNAIEFRYNAIIYFLLNIFLLWDFHCIFALEKWKETSGISLRKWLEIIAVFEGLSSLAVIAHMDSEVTYPRIMDKGVVLYTDNMGHPLINKDDRVANNIRISNEICIVTGSNMSGKTTFLRTIGINLVLAYAGAPVCAKDFKCSLMKIYTAMRIKDDLSNGISTFYAELLRIKKIIDYSKKQEKMLFLIDEIFKGTNSLDRIEGAKQVILNLYNPLVIGLVSTHDFEICQLQNSSRTYIKNYHFKETYANNRIKFDYKLRHGISTTRNARYLMRMIGIDVK